MTPQVENIARMGKDIEATRWLGWSTAWSHGRASRDLRGAFGRPRETLGEPQEILGQTSVDLGAGLGRHHGSELQNAFSYAVA